jgi:acetoin:2,6-dichlorophenolindophenol oxidoreductase subunit beta
VSDPITYAQAFQQGVREEMERDSSIIVLGTDLYERGGHFGQLKGLGAQFGEARVRDTPISEAAMVAAGVGAALNGLRPIVDLNFIDFAFGAMDEIANQAAKMRFLFDVPLPLVIRGSAGVAFYAAQHNNSFEAWFAHLPGLLVAAPATPSDTRGLIRSALRGDDPVIFLMHKRLSGLRGDAGPEDHVVPFGRAEIVRDGADVTLVAYSAMVSRARAAADVLAGDGIEADVIDLRTLVPLDLDLVVGSVRRTGRAVIVTEGPRFAGFGAEVAAAVQEEAFDYLDAPVVRVGGAHTPIGHSPALIDASIPQAEDIGSAVKALLSR